VIPWVPGHFTVYEWMALGIWVVIGVGAMGTSSGVR
jgi:hypothetical protein